LKLDQGCMCRDLVDKVKLENTGDNQVAADSINQCSDRIYYTRIHLTLKTWAL
jgi:hypothetical protein